MGCCSGATHVCGIDFCAAADCVASSGSCGPQPKVFMAHLRPSEEVPPTNVDPNEAGSAKFTLSADRKSVMYEGLADNIRCPIRAELRLAPKGRTGDRVFSLQGAPQIPHGYGFGGQHTMTASMADALESGSWYVEIDTVPYPMGEIRGQLVAE
jgi:hypothetical protein